MNGEILCSLQRISAGKGSLDELSRLLGEMEEMFFLPPSQRLVQYLQEIALQSGREPFEPPVHGTLHEGAFVPAVFTTVEAADALARANNFVAESEASLVGSKSWARGMHEFLLWGFGGAIIDGGTDRKICLNRNNLSIVVAKLTMGALLQAGRLFVAVESGAMHVHAPTSTDTVVFVFDSELAGQYGGEFLNHNVVGAEKVQLVQVAASELLAMLAQTRPNQMLVNAGLPDARPYFAMDLDELQRRGQAVV